MPCAWSEQLPCQFADYHGVPITEYQGRDYCQYHLPLSAPQKLDLVTPDYHEIIRRSRDLTGVQFIPGNYEFPDLGAKTKTTLDRVQFATDTVLALKNGYYSINDAIFHGSAKIENRRVTKVSLSRSKFCGPVRIEALYAKEQNSDQRAADWKIDGATFESEVDLSHASFVGSLNLSNANFYAPVQFEGCELPQQTVGHDVQFCDRAIDKDYEGSYRAARLALAQHRNRDLEGVLYAAEKRSQRKGMHPWWPSCWISTCYDYSSQYGHDYSRALAAFVVLQLVAFIGYSFHFGESGGRVVAFTLAQLVRPFELFSMRGGGAGPLSDLLRSSPPSIELMLATVAHTILSLVLVAIFLLAVRWRFRRE